MNKSIFKGHWNEMKGSVREQWGKLTDDDMDKIHGQYDQLVGKVQQRYGQKKDEAEKSVNDFLRTQNIDESKAS